MAKKDLSNLLGGHVDGMTILLMSLDILQKEVGEAVKAKKEKYDANKTDIDPDDFGAFMRHMSMIADIKGTEMAMEAISLSIATFAFSVQYNVNLNKWADIIKELGDGSKYQATEVMKSVAEKSGEPFAELKELVTKEFNLKEEEASDTVIKGVSEWVIKFLLDVEDTGADEDDFDLGPSNKEEHRYDA